MRPLYEIKGTLYQLFEELEHTEDQDLRAALESAIESCRDDYDLKLSNYCARFNNLKEELSSLENVIQKYKTRKASVEREMEWLENLVKKLVPSNWTSPDYINKITFRKTEKVDLLDGAKIEDVPPQYLRENLSYEIDKITAKKDIKCGATIPGLTLKSDRSVVIK